MTLSIIIVAFNVKQLLKACLQSILSSDFKDLEIIVVDSGSSDDPKSLHKLFPKVKFIEVGGNIGFSKANNIGASYAKGKYLFFLNPDTLVKPKSISNLVKFASNTSNLGAVSPRLLNPDGTTQPSCYRYPTVIGAIKEFWLGVKGAYLKYTPQHSLPTQVFCTVGAAVLIPQKSFKLIGGWDERYFMYFEDFELGRQIRNHHLDYWFLPSPEITHIHGASSSQYPDLSFKRLKNSSVIYHGYPIHLLITFIIKTSQLLKLSV